MVIFAGDYDSARTKGVDGLFLQYDEQGYFEKVVLVSPYRREDAHIILSERIELRQFGLGRGRISRCVLAPFHLLRVMVQCFRLVRGESISLIRATEPTLCGVVAWAAARFTGIPYCLSLHADYDKRFALDGRRGAPTFLGSRALVRPLERLTLRGAARVMPIRESLVAYVLARGVRRANVRVIPHGIDFTPFKQPLVMDIRQKLGIPTTKRIITFAGRLSAENYVDEMLDAARLLAERRDDFVLVVAGGGILEDEIAARLARDPVLSRVVRVVGFVSPDTVRALRMGGVVSICLMGGFSLIEACAAGRPVIAYDVEWHHELVITGRTGYLIREHDVEAVAAAMGDLMDDECEAARMGAEAQALAFERHDIGAVSEMKRRWYGEVLGA